MKIYTHYSDSHKDLYENYFKKSIRNLYSEDELKIRSASHKQTTRSGEFMEQGWLESMKYKLQVILQAIEENRNEYFIFSDVDIYYYDKFIPDLINRDLILLVKKIVVHYALGFLLRKVMIMLEIYLRRYIKRLLLW